MLLEFKIKNYKSFVQETFFSMMSAPKQTGLDYSVLNEKIGSFNYKGLCSAIIYGPNASGKTNLIGAMEVFRSIVLRGNINNNEVNISPNEAVTYLELIPNCSLKDEPTMFSISFIEKELLISYTLTIKLGSFLEKDYKRKIIEEKLYVNGKLVFLRNKDLEVYLPSSIKKFSNSSIKRISPKTIEIAKSSLVDTELFLTNGFKNIFAQELVSIMINWFLNKFIVIYRFDALRVMRQYADPSENTVYIEKTLTEVAKEFGINSNALGYRKDKSGEISLYSVLNNNDIAIPSVSFESYGTIRFINEFPLVIDAMLNGGTLVMDEFDASIHPVALMNIISIFHNNEINKNHAQLIFNTHNPIFLDSSLFRRDEIKFVEKDNKTNESKHYSLSDFKTADGVRKGEDYMNNYFIDRYGAIDDIDFGPILKKIIEKGK